MNKNDPIEIRIPTETEWPAVRQLRYQMLDKPVGLPESDKPSEHDLAPNVIHLAAFDGDKLVCCVRLDDIGDTRYLVRRMATVAEYQGQGIGRSVLEAAGKMAQKQGATATLLNSRENAVGFYEKQGYELTGNTKTFDGNEHFEMIKAL